MELVELFCGPPSEEQASRLDNSLTGGRRLRFLPEPTRTLTPISSIKLLDQRLGVTLKDALFLETSRKQAVYREALIQNLAPVL